MTQNNDQLTGSPPVGHNLFAKQTHLALENFAISGLHMPPAFIHALGLLKATAAQTNGELQLLDKAMAIDIERSAMEVASGQHDGQFPLDIFQTGSGTSTNMNANEVIATLATAKLGQDVHANDHVNMGQSSNDVIPSCIHISAALGIKQKLLPSLETLRKAIEGKSLFYQDTVKTGRTHLMDAMPITLGQELGGWAHQIEQCINRLNQALPRLCELAIGGTAVGTGINTHDDFAKSVCDKLAHATGVNFHPSPNYFSAISSQDTAVEISGHLKTLAVSLMKISNDLRWMNSGPIAGLGEISLPKLQAGSSIMPGKVNPVIPEAVTMVCAQVIGNDTTITVAGQSGNFQLNTMLPVIAYNLLQSIEILANAAQSLSAKAIIGLRADKQKMAQCLTLNPILVTALNARVGYEKGAEIAQAAYLQKRPVLDVALEMTNLNEEELTRMLDPKNMI
jgi:fumarate hydratase class II